MVLRVDVVAAALEAAYGGAPTTGDRAVAAGAPARPAARRGARGGGAPDAALGALRGLRRADRRAPRSDALSIGPYVLSGGELPAMVLRRRDRAAPARGARARAPPSTRASRPSSRAASSTRTTPVPPSSAAGRCPRCSSRATMARIDDWRREQSRERSAREEPVDRLTEGMPHAWRVAIDWLVDDRRRDPDRARDQGRGSSTRTGSRRRRWSRRSTARGPGHGCEARFSDRVLANRFIYHFRNPKRGDIVVFNTPPRGGASAAAPAARSSSA